MGIFIVVDSCVASFRANGYVANNSDATVEAIAKGAERLSELGRLQYEFLESHSEIANNIFKSDFSDGTVIVCNYSDAAFNFGGRKIAPMSYTVFSESSPKID